MIKAKMDVLWIISVLTAVTFSNGYVPILMIEDSTSNQSQEDDLVLQTAKTEQLKTNINQNQMTPRTVNQVKSKYLEPSPIQQKQIQLRNPNKSQDRAQNENNNRNINQQEQIQNENASPHNRNPNNKAQNQNNQYPVQFNRNQNLNVQGRNQNIQDQNPNQAQPQNTQEIFEENIEKQNNNQAQKQSNQARFENNQGQSLDNPIQYTDNPALNRNIPAPNLDNPALNREDQPQNLENPLPSLDNKILNLENPSPSRENQAQNHENPIQNRDNQFQKPAQIQDQNENKQQKPDPKYRRSWSNFKRFEIRQRADDPDDQRKEITRMPQSGFNPSSPDFIASMVQNAKANTFGQFPNQDISSLSQGQALNGDLIPNLVQTAKAHTVAKVMSQDDPRQQSGMDTIDRIDKIFTDFAKTKGPSSMIYRAQQDYGVKPSFIKFKSSDQPSLKLELTSSSIVKFLETILSSPEARRYADVAGQQAAVAFRTLSKQIPELRRYGNDYRYEDHPQYRRDDIQGY